MPRRVIAWRSNNTNLKVKTQVIMQKIDVLDYLGDHVTIVTLHEALVGTVWLDWSRPPTMLLRSSIAFSSFDGLGACDKCLMIDFILQYEMRCK